MIRKNNYNKNKKEDTYKINNINNNFKKVKKKNVNTRISAKRVVWLLLVIILTFVILIRKNFIFANCKRQRSKRERTIAINS